MSTKLKIIKQAILLFNQSGVANVSIANICDALGLSKGNLTYHFASKELVIESTLAYMVDSINQRINSHGASATKMSLSQYFALIENVQNFQQEFSFFYTDILEIMRGYPQVAAFYHQQMKLRQLEGQELIRFWQNSGWLQQQIGASQLEYIQHTIWMLLTFWRSQQLLLADEARCSLSISIYYQLFPYLTDEGKAQCILETNFRLGIEHEQ